MPSFSVSESNTRRVRLIEAAGTFVLLAGRRFAEFLNANRRKPGRLVHLEDRVLKSKVRRSSAQDEQPSVECTLVTLAERQSGKAERLLVDK